MNENYEPYRELRNAIYAQATEDYIKAICKKNNSEIQFLENFLTSCAYCMETNMGKCLISTAKKEIEICQKLIDGYSAQKLKTLEVNPKIVSINVLKMLVQSRYRKKLSVRLSKRHGDKYILCRYKRH